MSLFAGKFNVVTTRMRAWLLVGLTKEYRWSLECAKDARASLVVCYCIRNNSESTTGRTSATRWTSGVCRQQIAKASQRTARHWRVLEWAHRQLSVEFVSRIPYWVFCPWRSFSCGDIHIAPYTSVQGWPQDRGCPLVQLADRITSNDPTQKIEIW